MEKPRVHDLGNKWFAELANDGKGEFLTLSFRGAQPYALILDPEETAQLRDFIKRAEG